MGSLGSALHLWIQAEFQPSELLEQVSKWHSRARAEAAGYPLGGGFAQLSAFRIRSEWTLVDLYAKGTTGISSISLLFDLEKTAEEKGLRTVWVDVHDATNTWRVESSTGGEHRVIELTEEDTHRRGARLLDSEKEQEACDWLQELCGERLPGVWNYLEWWDAFESNKLQGAEELFPPQMLIWEGRFLPEPAPATPFWREWMERERQRRPPLKEPRAYGPVARLLNGFFLLFFAFVLPMLLYPGYFKQVHDPDHLDQTFFVIGLFSAMASVLALIDWRRSDGQVLPGWQRVLLLVGGQLTSALACWAVFT